MNKIMAEYRKFVGLMLLTKNPLYSETEWKWHVIFTLSIMEAWFIAGVYSIINWITGFDLFRAIFPIDLLNNKLVLFGLNIFFWLLPILVLNHIIVNRTYDSTEVLGYPHKRIKKLKIKIVLFFLVCGGLPIIVTLFRNLF